MQLRASSSKVRIRSKLWEEETPPKKIIVIRFQALGDTIITLPYLQNLKEQYPQTQLIFLTRKEVCSIPQASDLFDEVIAIGGGRNAKLQLVQLILKIPKLLHHKADAVLDLQNNKLSRIVRKVLQPKAWTAFDTHSHLAAGERTRLTIESLWRWKISPEPRFHINRKTNALSILKANGYKESNRLVVLNPAGFCPSRNWPLDHYVNFALQWREGIDNATQFVLLLLERHKEKSDYIREKLSTQCIDLTGITDQLQAFEIIGRSDFVLTEDSGLMHMSWVQGVPTLALFSSSRKDWSAPQGSSSLCLDSADLPCGPCELEVCQYGDNRCITRYSPEYVLSHAKVLLDKKAAHV